MNTLLHYTSFCAALQILLSGKVIFNNIKNCNDQVEIDSVKGEEDNYLIFCGCNNKSIDSLMWFSYAKNKYGACICFNIKKRKRKNSLLKTNDARTKIDHGEIKYICGSDNDNNNNNRKGFVKDKVFKKEAEYRYLVKTKEEIFFAEIDWTVVDSVTLYLSSFFDKDIVESIFNQSAKCKVNVDIEKRFKMN